MLLFRGKSTYPGCSVFRNHLSSGGNDDAGQRAWVGGGRGAGDAGLHAAVGRYVKRTEGILRLLRARHVRLAESGEGPLLAAMAPLLTMQGVEPARCIPEGMLETLGSAIRAAGQIRGRLSRDGWAALADLDKTARRMAERVEPGTDAARAVGALLRKLSGFSGLVHENMYRFLEWRFLELGLPAGWREVTYLAEAEVERIAPPRPAGATLLAGLAGVIAAVQGLGPQVPHHFRGPSPRIAQDRAIIAFAQEVVAGAGGEGADALVVVEALGRAIHAGMVFDAAATTVETPPAEAFARRIGVCQDFAHHDRGVARGRGAGGLCLGPDPDAAPAGPIAA